MIRAVVGGGGGANRYLAVLHRVPPLGCEAGRVRTVAAGGIGDIRDALADRWWLGVASPQSASVGSVVR